MARLNINIGTTANDKTGDPLRTAFDKVNQNFVELYAHVGVDVQIPSQTNNANKYLTTNGTTLRWDYLSNSMYAGGPGDLRWEFEELSDDEGETYYGRINFPDGTSQYTAFTGTQLVNGGYTVSLGTDGLVSVTGAIGWALDENSPTLTDATINKVGDNLEIKTNLNLDPYIWSFSNLSKLTLPSGAVIDTYADGAENSTYFWGGNGQVIAVRGMNAENVFGGGININPDGSVAIIAQDENSATWTFTEDGNLTVPDRITFNDGSWQSTAFVGLASTAQDLYKAGEIFIGIGDGVTTTQQWSFGTDGRLTVPGNITKASGNLEITAENYVVIDSTNGGQIDIGANQSGEGSGDSGPILMGHAGNTLDIQSGKIRVNSAVPTHSTGALNDVAGLVAFDGSYIYYCTADYVPVGGGGSTVELVPNELGQSVNTITIAKGAPPNTNWANLQVSWTLTVNSTTVTVEEITGDADNLYVVVSGFITLPPTGSITFTEPGGTQPNIWKRVAWSNDTW